MELKSKTSTFKNSLELNILRTCIHLNKSEFKHLDHKTVHNPTDSTVWNLKLAVCRLTSEDFQGFHTIESEEELNFMEFSMLMESEFSYQLQKIFTQKNSFSWFSCETSAWNFLIVMKMTFKMIISIEQNSISYQNGLIKITCWYHGSSFRCTFISWTWVQPRIYCKYTIYCC